MDIDKEAYDRSKTLKKDKQVVLEIRAMAYFLKVEKAIKGGNTSGKVKAVLQKMMKTCPESFAAKRAQEELQWILPRGVLVLVFAFCGSEWILSKIHTPTGGGNERTHGKTF